MTAYALGGRIRTRLRLDLVVPQASDILLTGSRPASFKNPSTLSTVGANSPNGLRQHPHQPREPHPPRLHQIQPTRTGLTWRLSAIRRVLGAGAPKTLHVAQIHHTIRHTLNTGTCRHIRRHRQRVSPTLRYLTGMAVRRAGDHRPAPRTIRPAASSATRPAASSATLPPCAAHRPAARGKPSATTVTTRQPSATTVTTRPEPPDVPTLRSANQTYIPRPAWSSTLHVPAE